MIRPARSLLLATFILGAAGVAVHAQTPIVGSFSASACVPNDRTTKFDRHDTGIGSLRHAGGNIDPIVLTCPIPRFDFRVDGLFRLSFVYQDSTGDAPEAAVRVRLYRLPIAINPPLAPPSVTPVLVTTATSESSASTGIHKAEMEFRHSFSFDDNIYWFRVEIDRSAATQTVVLHAIYLAAPVAVGALP